MIDLKILLESAQKNILRNGGPETVQKLVREHYGDIEAIDEFQATVIVAAYEAGRLAMLDRVLSGTDVSVQFLDDPRNQELLHYEHDADGLKTAALSYLDGTS